MSWSPWEIFLCFSAVLVCLTEVSSNEFSVVKTRSGPVKGTISKHEKGTMYKFLRIPFAQPPVGYLRFRKPLPVVPWNDVIDATQHPPSCVQANFEFFTKLLPTSEMSEDCLFLSIYVPNEISSSKKKSVMVWIYGGGYNFGQASMYDGSYLALTGDVIVVTFNYRVNALGFLTTWDPAALGNYGLWDQVMALRWVKDNIEHFGGNPDSITIFGESAGGFSAGFMALIPQNHGLFQRVITQSGVAISPYAYNNMHTYLPSLVEEVGCSNITAGSYAVVECLRHVPAEKIANASDRAFYMGLNHFMIPYAPRIDNDLIYDAPENILADDQNPGTKLFRSLDYMAGFTDADGDGVLYSAQNTLNPEHAVNVTDGIPTDFMCNVLLPQIVGIYYYNYQSVSEALCKLYSVENGNTTNKFKQAQKTLDAYGDFSTFVSTINSLNAHVKGQTTGSTYRYVFSRNYDTKFGQEMPKWFKGAPHGSELAFLFGLKHFSTITNFTISPEDMVLADIMMKYWTNFAKTGDPNSDSLPRWAKYTSNNMEFMNLNHRPQTENASEDFKIRIKTWVQDIPKILHSMNLTVHDEL